jgi:16S rRNA (cytidine1402-2'-O)-methyltransferase
VFFESPHRISKTIAILLPTLGKRPFMIARELTKMHEQLVERPINAVGLEKGEIAAVIGPWLNDKAIPDARKLSDLIWCLTNKLALDTDDASALAARAVRIPLAKVKKALKLARYAEHERRHLDD